MTGSLRAGGNGILVSSLALRAWHRRNVFKYVRRWVVRQQSHAAERARRDAQLLVRVRGTNSRASGLVGEPLLLFSLCTTSRERPETLGDCCWVPRGGRGNSPPTPKAKVAMGAVCGISRMRSGYFALSLGLVSACGTSQATGVSATDGGSDGRSLGVDCSLTLDGAVSGSARCTLLLSQSTPIRWVPFARDTDRRRDWT